MQYVGRVLNTVSEFYKELNPSTLSGAIDIIVAERADGTLACTPFHVRFGKFQLLRPSEKVVDLLVNGQPVSVHMKLGDAGEAFFVIESDQPVPQEFATSPITEPLDGITEPDYLDLGDAPAEYPNPDDGRQYDGYALATPKALSPLNASAIARGAQSDPGEDNDADTEDEADPSAAGSQSRTLRKSPGYSLRRTWRWWGRSQPPPSPHTSAVADKPATNLPAQPSPSPLTSATASTKTSATTTERALPTLNHARSESELMSPRSKAHTFMDSTDHIALPMETSERPRHYAKTLRLTSDQLKQMGLQYGVNSVKFTVRTNPGANVCTAKIFFLKHDTQLVISDIDGTITKSDALGHIFTMVGKDWTHIGVAKLYTDITRNGYQIMYLTSRAIGQADATRAYLRGVTQGPYHLPDGPVIMSPDRLFESLHREVIARQPQVFKMACLRDVKSIFGDRNPFYAGFGNRITDALSYRSVNVPTSRIFTIEYSGEVKLELLAGYRSSYLSLNSLVDQIFPPVTENLVTEYNDWNYWK
ncbi:Lipin/Ned1/Smp2-domain-containing protein, partial [Dimargaris cristalligena]